MASWSIHETCLPTATDTESARNFSSKIYQKSSKMLLNRYLRQFVGVIDGGGARLEIVNGDVMDALRLGEDGEKWFTFRTNPRREKKMASWFAERDFRHFLPLRSKSVRRHGRRLTSKLPLFPGYIFGCCSEETRLRAMQSGHLAQWLDVVDQPRFLSELREISIASARSDDLRLFPTLTRGAWIRVVNGPLAGVTGRISRRKQDYRVVLNLSTLNCAVAAEVDIQDVTEEPEPDFGVPPLAEPCHDRSR